MSGDDMSMDAVFKAITEHNKRLAEEGRFITMPLNLVYRANNVQKRYAIFVLKIDCSNFRTPGMKRD